MTQILRAAIATVVLVYIGNKRFKEDNVCNSGVTWLGYGDGQEVDRKNLAEYLKHPQVWVTEEEFKKIQERKLSQPETQPEIPPGDIGSGAQDSETDAGDQDIDDDEDQDEDENPFGDPDPVDPEGDQGEGEGDQDSSDDDSKSNADTGSILTKIKNAIVSLDPENAEHFTKSGQPKVAAVQALVEEPVNAQDVIAAWKELKAE